MCMYGSTIGYVCSQLYALCNIHAHCSSDLNILNMAGYSNLRAEILQVLEIRF